MENAKDFFENLILKEPIGRFSRLGFLNHEILFKVTKLLRFPIWREINQLYVGAQREVVWKRAPGNGRLYPMEKQWEKKTTQDRTKSAGT